MLDQEQHIRATVLVCPVLVGEVDTSRVPNRMANATLRYILWRIHNGRLQEEVCISFLYLPVAHDGVERNPYGTPISLPIHSPFHMLSSSQDDPVGVPDSPRLRALARSNDNHRAAPSLNAERAKSESPELSMSIQEYPASQAAEEPTTFVSLTPSSSQITLGQAYQRPGTNAIPQTLPHLENSPQARRPSPHTGSSITHPPSHRGYHILRSVPQERPSQTDPIETDDSLSQEQIPRDRLTKRHLGHSLPVTSITLDQDHVRSPNDSTSDQRDIQFTGPKDLSNPRTGQSAGACAQSSGPPTIRGATLSKRLSKPPLAKTAIDLQGHLPALAARREGPPDQSVQVPMIERNDAENSQDLSLDIEPTSYNNTTPGIAFTTGHYPREVQPATTTDLAATEETSSLQTPAVRKSIFVLTPHVDENPASQLQMVEAPMGHTAVRSETQPKPIPGPSDRPTTVADGDAQVDHEMMASVKSSKKQDGDAKLKKPEHATQEDQKTCDTEVLAFDGGKTTGHGENTAECTSVSGGSISQKQARPAVLYTSKKKSRATQEAVSMDGSDCRTPQQSSVSKTEISGRKTGLRFEHTEGDRGISGTEIEKAMIKTDRSADEKRKAEERAKREADAIAQFLAKEEKKSCTPASKSASKRKRGNSNQATQSLTPAASVQEDRKASIISTRQPSLPKVGDESIGKPKSMTPLFPSSSSSLIRPTKSALRTSQSSTPRSVSFHDDPIAPPGPLKTSASKWVEPKIESRNSASGTAKGSKATSKKIIAKPNSSHIGVEHATAVMKDMKAGGSKTVLQVVKPTASAVVTGLPKPKTQTKLNITRDVKLKGRADGPPKSPTPAIEKEENIASDSEISASTFYSDEENLPRSARAGPSKKRKLTHAMKSVASSLDIGSKEKQQPHTTDLKNEFHPSVPSAKSMHISDQNSTVRHPSISASNPKPQAKSSSPSVNKQNVVAVAQVDSREASKSRSPAQYISGASRASSGSASDAGQRAGPRSVDESVSESGSQYETGSDSEDASASSSDLAETDSMMDSNGGTSLSNGFEKEENFKSSKSQSQASNKPSNRKAPSASSLSASQSRMDEEDKAKVARNLDQQLQRDARHSMKPSWQETTVQSAVKIEKPTPISTVKPGVSRFPSLTGLRGKALKTDDNAGATATQAPKTHLLSNIPSKPVKQLQTQTADDTSSSSSGSEDETSSSDDEQNKVNGQSSTESAQKTTMPQPRPMKGIRAILKRMFSDDVSDT